MNATVTVISPILVDGAWIHSGEAVLPLERAEQEMQAGMVVITAIDGEPVSRGACCADH